jgi:endonuclease YncB( thermonuclease family)
MPLTSIDFPFVMVGSPAYSNQARTQRRVMTQTPARFAAVASACTIVLAAAASPADAAGCAFEPQGEGRVASVIDARTFRLEDGREVRLAGIEPNATDQTSRTAALSAIVIGHEVTLRGEDDTPDRYGRQRAYAFVDGSETPVQALLLAQGEVLVSGTVANRDCGSLLANAEAEARREKHGTWSNSSAIKNAESPGDILTGIGRFMVVEGRVLSVRQAGATTYLNFGRNWTRDFAVTISRRVVPAVEAGGIALKSLENRRIRVLVETRGGPRIELLRVGQLELLGGN